MTQFNEAREANTQDAVAQSLCFLAHYNDEPDFTLAGVIVRSLVTLAFQQACLLALGHQMIVCGNVVLAMGVAYGVWRGAQRPPEPSPVVPVTTGFKRSRKPVDVLPRKAA